MAGAPRLRGGNRRVKRRIVALAMVLSLVAGAVLAGCAKSQQPAAPGQPTPAKEKVLVYARGSDSISLDPALVDDGESAKVMNNLYDNLVRYKKGSTDVEPALATTWEHSNDGKVWTFHLRKGVKFHDGGDFNADAVVFSFTRQMKPNATDDMPYAGFTFDPAVWDKVEKVDDYTVRITLKTPYAPFLRNLAMGLAAPIISPTAFQKDPKGFGQHPVGTGPFMFEKWDKEQQIVLKAFDQYWGGRPAVDKVIFKVTKENTVRADELIAGQVDMIDGVAPQDLDRLKASKDIRVLMGPGMNINYIGFRVDRKPFNNPDVRQAVSMAFNREAAIKALYKDVGALANGPLPPGLSGYDPSLKPYAYNPDEAKKLLEKAGYSPSNPLKFDLYAYTNPRPYNPAGDKLAEALKADLAKIGVEMKIVSNPWKEHKQAVQKDKKGEAYLFGWIGDNGDPDNFLFVHFHSSQIGAGLNNMFYKNDQVDKLLADAAQELNETARAKLYSDAQKLIVADAPWIFVSHAQDIVAMRANIANYSLHPTGSVWLREVMKLTAPQ